MAELHEKCNGFLKAVGGAEDAASHQTGGWFGARETPGDLPIEYLCTID